MEIPKKDEENNVDDAENEETKEAEKNIPNKEGETESDDKPSEEIGSKQNVSEENKTTAGSVSEADQMDLDDILSQIVQDTIINSPLKTDQSSTEPNNSNNKRKPTGTTAKQPAKTRRQAEPKAQINQGESKPRIRSAPSVFLQRSSRAPAVPKQVAKKNMADQYNNCVHGDPGDYLCSDCFYNRWKSEWDYLQPIQSK